MSLILKKNNTFCWADVIEHSALMPHSSVVVGRRSVAPLQEFRQTGWWVEGGQRGDHSSYSRAHHGTNSQMATWLAGLQSLNSIIWQMVHVL